MSKNRGFTLIEMMIVVAVLTTIIAVVIPSMARARVTADEAAAQANLKAIFGAEVSYNASHKQYATDWNQLTSDPSGGPPFLLDPQWVEGRILSGYIFTGAFSTSSFTITAEPQTPNRTGVRTFTINEAGSITATP